MSIVYEPSGPHHNHTHTLGYNMGPLNYFIIQVAIALRFCRFKSLTFIKTCCFLMLDRALRDHHTKSEWSPIYVQRKLSCDRPIIRKSSCRTFAEVKSFAIGWIINDTPCIVWRPVTFDEALIAVMSGLICTGESRLKRWHLLKKVPALFLFTCETV